MMMDHTTAVKVKPSRSDDVLDPQQQMMITDQVRAQFDSICPKRPTKPDRSEPESTLFTPALPGQDVSLPVFDKFRALRSQSDQVIYSGADPAQEEFVETQYYKQLDSIDKQHHTTGSGFIRVTREGDGDEYEIQLQNGHQNGGKKVMIFKTNPATNDWTPKLDNDNQGIYLSAKPKRSESD